MGNDVNIDKLIAKYKVKKSESEKLYGKSISDSEYDCCTKASIRSRMDCMQEIWCALIGDGDGVVMRDLDKLRIDLLSSVVYVDSVKYLVLEKCGGVFLCESLEHFYCRCFGIDDADSERCYVVFGRGYGNGYFYYRDLGLAEDKYGEFVEYEKINRRIET